MVFVVVIVFSVLRVLVAVGVIVGVIGDNDVVGDAPNVCDLFIVVGGSLFVTSLVLRLRLPFAGQIVLVVVGVAVLRVIGMLVVCVRILSLS